MNLVVIIAQVRRRLDEEERKSTDFYLDIVDIAQIPKPV